MSILSITRIPVQSKPRRIVPEGWQAAKCSQCNAALFIREDDSYTPTCMNCRGMWADDDAELLLGLIVNVVQGTGTFNVISTERRQQLLNRIGLKRKAQANTDEAPAILADAVAAVDDPNSLVNYQVADRMVDDVFPQREPGDEGYRPTPAEQDEIESRVEAGE